MSQAEELLNSLSEEIPVHTHPVPDTDTYFVIDPVTRKIENTNPKKNVIMQYDHNSERCTFELPRFIDGHDMLECTSVTVNVDNIEVVESDGVEEVEPTEPRVNSDAPDITDLRIHPTDSEKAICSWLISRNSTQLAGILSFHIEFKCVDSNGNVVYEWSTDNYDEIEVRARNKNGEAAVVEHTDLLEQWRTRIFGAGESVMANITAEGEAQVAAVKAESETQQEAVELKGAQTLESIPEDYTEVDAMADEAVRTKSDAIVCEAAGESIVLKDSSNDYIRGLKLFGKSTQKTTTGKNLLNVDENLSFTGLREKTVNIPAGTYVLTWAGRTTAGQNKPVIRFVDNSILIDLLADVGNSKVTLAKDETTIYIYSNGYDYAASENVSATITQLMLSVDGGTYEPYTGGIPAPNPDYPQEIVSIENPTMRIFGKNLLPKSATNETYAGLTIVVNDDQSITVNGTATDVVYYAPFRFTFKSGMSYVVSGCPTGGSNDTYFMYVNNLGGVRDYGDGALVRLDNDFTSDVGFCIRSGSVINNFTFYPMVRMANTQSGYEESNIQSISSKYALPGIPVTSGGNYADENGQQWICDEIDLERGVYVQNTAIVNLYDFVDKFGVFSDNSNYSDTILRFDFGYAFGCRVVTPVLCNRFVYDYAHGNLGSLARVKEGISSHSASDIITVFIDKSRLDTPDKDGFKSYLQNNETIVCYALATPIETSLTAEEITAFKALRTNYPNTTILNDAGAWMSVKYNADTKTYVENPKTLKLVDSSTGVVYELKVVDGNLTVVPIQ